LLQRRPAGKEVAEQRSVAVIEPVQRLRKVLLERVAKAVDDALAVVDQHPSLLDQVPERTHCDALGMERMEPLRVAQHKLQRKLRIGGIVLGAAGLECHTILRQQAWVDREQDDEVVLLQCVDDRSTGEFERNGNRATEPRLQSLDPSINLVRLMREPAKFSRPTAAWLKTEVVLGVRPVQADLGSKLRACWRTHGCTSQRIKQPTRPAA